MNRWLFLHRIKWPVMLLVFGVTALLDEWNILSYDRSWPLYLIAFGALQLAERAAWSEAQYPEQYAGQTGNWGQPMGPPPPAATPFGSTPLAGAGGTDPGAGPQGRPRGFGPEDEGRK